MLSHRIGNWTAVTALSIMAAISPQVVGATVCTSDITLSSQAQVDAFDCVNTSFKLIITGADITNLNGLSSLLHVGTDLNIVNNPLLADISGLSNLASTGAQLRIINCPQLTNLDGLSSLTTVGTDLRIEDNPALTSVSGLSSLGSTGAQLRIVNDDGLVTLEGMSMLTSVGSDLTISNNDALVAIAGLSALTSTGNKLNILSNPVLISLAGITSLTDVGTDLNVQNNPMLNMCCGLEPLFTSGTVHGSTNISGNLTGCNSQSEIVTSGPCPVTSIIDVTPGSASRDGVIGAGEYAGSSVGINSGFGNVIGSGSELFIDSRNDGTVNLGLRGGGGGLFDAVVIYIDTGTGGFASTANFTDSADPLRRALSGFDGFNRSQIDFGANFRPSYAIGLDATFSGLWSLVENGSHNYLRSNDLLPVNDSNAGEWEIAFNMSDLGLAPGADFKYVVTYLNSGNAYRSDEFHGVSSATVPSGNPAYSTVTLGAGDYNRFVSVGMEVPAASTLLLIICSLLLAGCGTWFVWRTRIRDAGYMSNA